eukprot:gnl/Spiro4/7305_TR3822_c0_g1_i1.p1 gnl/Spiro4/7305_TR3822_c0_g1~~gnl/Spiro4/7305_TR3822_c0_g1_i1.p1  ORF type:complete len:586 (-),score=132.00 gnl/Spiro4/7305_TR3822_c0_g1_i1:123-1880(-)
MDLLFDSYADAPDTIVSRSDAPPPSSRPPVRSVDHSGAAPMVQTNFSSIGPLTLAVAPSVAVFDQRTFINPNDRELDINPTFDEMWAPVHGPQHPRATRMNKNTPTGFLEPYNTSKFLFDEQYNTFQTFGYARDPSTNAVVGDLEKYRRNNGDTIVTNTSRRVEKKRARPSGDPGTSDYLGPWAPFADESLAPVGASKEEREEYEKNKPVPKRIRHKPQAPAPGKEEADVPGAEAEEEALPQNKCAPTADDVSTFHGSQLYDYQGRSYIHPPSDLKPRDHHAILPKTRIHTWSGHTKGVSNIRFFPRYGHLLLSAGLDNKVKIWDVYNQRSCLRTYHGHTKGVKDINFNSDGTRFLSSGYDKVVKLWDTETGTCIGNYSMDKIPNVAKFIPGHENQFIVGQADKKLIQWDSNTGAHFLEYTEHLGPVNTVTFVDNNRRFVSSSDDRTLRFWEVGIPVVIKYVAEPHMHSMPAISTHPSNKWFAAQSMDSAIYVYSSVDKFKMNKKKQFKGHMVDGFACKISFSPDGRYIISGDRDGKLYIWDWASCKLYKTMRVHDGVVIGCEWHPIEPSRVATCGWDGSIKYWD